MIHIVCRKAPRVPHGYSGDVSRRRRGCRVDIPWRKVWRRRGCDVDSPRRQVAATPWRHMDHLWRRVAATLRSHVDISWRRVAATPRPRRGNSVETGERPYGSSVETSRGAAAAGDAPRRPARAGRYTTARTHQGKLFEWSTHVDRTAATILAMDPTPPARSLAEHGGPFFRARLDGAAAAAISTYRALQGDAGEVKVTILVSWDEEKCSVAAHAGPLPPLPARPVRVEVRGEGRANAAAKDSGWVAERAPLEKLMAAAEVGPVNELLLKDYQGRILEGSQTNFYAVVAGKLVTAGDDILKGTVRRLAIEVCEREGIPVVLEPPDLDNVADWDGCLISSTSRLMLPIDELFVRRADVSLRRIAATPRPRRGYSVETNRGDAAAVGDESRRRRGCRVDSPRGRRADAGMLERSWRRIAATPQPWETSRGDAAGAA